MSVIFTVTIQQGNATKIVFKREFFCPLNRIHFIKDQLPKLYPNAKVLKTEVEVVEDITIGDDDDE